MSITTTTRVKGALGIPAGVTFHDTAIGYAVDFANGRVLRALGQQQLAVTTTQEYPVVYGAGQESVLLRHTPVVQIVALTNDDSLLTTEDYWLDTEDLGALRLKEGAGYWSYDRQGVQVLYTWGYTSATVPAELTGAADAIAVSAYNRGKHAGLTQRSAGGYSYQLSDQDLPPDARAVLSCYEDAHR